MTATSSAAVSNLHSLFRPRSLAIVGASTDPNKIGGRPIYFLKKAGYSGAIYPVNPSNQEVQGIPAFASVSAIPEAMDQAIIALPANRVLPALEECIARGVQSVQVFSAGFAEVDAKGKALQEELRARAAEAGVRLLGPNSLGLFNVADGFFGTFATALDGAWPKTGTIGMATQSGAFGSYIFAMAVARGLGFSHFVATGNEADVDVAECIAYLAQDEATKVIVATMEGCKHGERLMAALATAHEAKKPVILMKAGASEAGAAAAASHTGSLAGADTVYDAVFRQYHAYRATTIDELLDITYACARGVLPENDRIGVITTSGGIGVLMADAASEAGLTLPTLPDTVQQQVQELLPYASGRNPVDTTAQLIGDLSLYARMLEIMLSQNESSFDTVIGYLAHIGRNPAHFAQLKAPLYAVRQRFPDRLFVLCMLADETLRAELEAEGFLVFEEPSRAIKAVGAAAWFGRGFAQPISQPVITPEAAQTSFTPDQPLNEYQASQILAEAGVPMAPLAIAASVEEAVAAARQIGFPVALKILSPEIQHKSEVGGVLLNLNSEEAVRQGFAKVWQNAQQAAPQASLEGVLVAPMVQGGTECILGVQRDPVFGPVVMFGLGGIFVEVFRDVAFRVAPFGEAEALELINQTRGAALLRGVRGRPSGDIKGLARALANLSAFAYANRATIESIDINPVLVLSDRVIGVDALVIPNRLNTDEHR
jgi:acyl-CoA synthetase (NDP forming)